MGTRIDRLRHAQLPPLMCGTCHACNGACDGAIRRASTWEPTSHSPILLHPPPRTVGRQAGWGLGATWWALVAFYVTRLAGHSLHYWRTGGGVFAGRNPGSSGSSGIGGVSSGSSSGGGGGS